MNSLFKILAGNQNTSHHNLITYSGDSMFPKYKTGDLLKIFQIANPEVILWGESYLIITNNEANSLKVVRNIFPHPDNSKLLLRAIDKENYSEILINKSDILYLFIIKGKLEINHL